jgi:hypothetical protein
MSKIPEYRVGQILELDTRRIIFLANLPEDKSSK